MIRSLIIIIIMACGFVPAMAQAKVTTPIGMINGHAVINGVEVKDFSDFTVEKPTADTTTLTVNWEGKAYTYTLTKDENYPKGVETMFKFILIATLPTGEVILTYQLQQWGSKEVEIVPKKKD